MARVVRCPSCGATATTAAIQSGECSYCASALVGSPARREPAVAGAVPPQRSAAPLVVSVVLMLVLAGGGAAIFLASGESREVPRPHPQPSEVVQVSAAAPEPAPIAAPSPRPEPAPALAAAGTAVLQEAAPEPEPPPKEPTEAERLAAVPADRWQRLNGCLCRVDLDGKPGAETVQLGLHHLGTNTTITGAGTRNEHQLGFAVFAGGAPVVLAAAETTAPPSRLVGARMGIGVGCAGGKLIVASQSTVSAWSLQDWKLVWSTPLDGTFPRGEDAGGGIALNCQPLQDKRGVVSVQREGDKPLRVQIEDGSIAH